MYNQPMSDFYSRQGDDGYTGLIGKGRVPKHHPRPEAFGAVDEASSALGVARASIGDPELEEVLITIQRDLYAMMAILATTGTPKRSEGFLEDRLTWLEGEIERYGSEVELPRGFVVAGDSLPGAFLDLARTQVRRAERKVAKLVHSGDLGSPHLLPYLNRLSSFCFLLMLRIDQKVGIQNATMAKRQEG